MAYGGGILRTTGKPPTVEDYKKYDINLLDLIDPVKQIQNFSENLVNGGFNIVEGLINKDGRQFGQGLGEFFNAAGSMYGINRVLKVPTIPLVSTRAGLSQLRLSTLGDELIKLGVGKDNYIISAVTNSKTGKTYFGANKGIMSLDEVHKELKDRLPKESLEKWTVFNCAECDAFNKALKDGAKWEDLGDLHTKQWDNASKKYVDVERCDNCKISFKDKEPTSEK